MNKVAAKSVTKSALLEMGMNIMLEKGYSNTGIAEILGALNIPKGSFYHYFESKENYAVEIIHSYDERQTADLIRILRDTELSPLSRLRAYCEEGKTMLSARECRKGCLVGNLSQEMADQSEVLRQELSSVLNKWQDMFIACIDEGQAVGEITKQFPAQALAELFQAGWTGAMLRAKTVKSTHSLDVFITVFVDAMLRAG
ncbi:MAG: TetR family transcriptional regulator C-terminal domain-containing protein [Candidatus Obscuribacterales bacterium]|nr:TetR family transcriptional regulator C-terminal domain-containing protein [Candidatus Obscuribacterales bacterium]